MSGKENNNHTPRELESLEAFKATLNEPLFCQLTIGGKDIKIRCQRLPAAKQAEIDVIWSPRATVFWMASSEVQPPRKKGDDGKLDYDVEDPDYQGSLKSKRREARALTVYHGVPMLQEAKPGLKDRHEIQRFIETTFSDVLLDMLYETIVGEGLGGLLERANFTGTSESQSS